MRKTLLEILLLICCIASFAFAQSDFKSELNKYRSDFAQAKTPQEKLALLEAFILKYPDERRASHLIWQGGRIYLDELKDPDAAINLAKKVIAKTSNKELIQEHRVNLLSILGRANRSTEIRQLAEEFLKDGELSWREHSAIAGASFQSKDWEFALGHFESTLAKATPEYFASQPGWQKERIEYYIKWLQGKTYTNMGIALEKLNRIPEALQTFEKAHTSSNHNFLGIADNNYMIYWGKALFKSGQYEQALDRLAPAAIIAGSKEAKDIFQQAFYALKGKDADLENFIAQKTAELQQSAPDFTLLDYDNNPVSLSSYKGKVVFLNFWFPT